MIAINNFVSGESCIVALTPITTGSIIQRICPCPYEGYKASGKYGIWQEPLGRHNLLANEITI